MPCSFHIDGVELFLNSFVGGGHSHFSYVVAFFSRFVKPSTKVKVTTTTKTILVGVQVIRSFGSQPKIIVLFVRCNGKYIFSFQKQQKWIWRERREKNSISSEILTKTISISQYLVNVNACDFNHRSVLLNFSFFRVDSICLYWI